MIHLASETLALTVQENGRDLRLHDLRRSAEWRLDETTLVYGATHRIEERRPLVPIAARADAPDRCTVTLQAGEAAIAVCYVLKRDYVEVQLPVPDAPELRMAALPGSFIPAQGDLRLLLPIMQGMLWDGRGPECNVQRGESSHTGFSMSFIGYLGERGGLLLTAETADDQVWWYGKDDSRHFWAANVQIDSLGTMRYTRIVRLYPTDASITAVAKRYRGRAREKGQFVTWDEKLEQRPALERLFGALMCFIGYCRDDVDYVEGCRRLKDYGFERALVYPVRFNVYDPDIRMGGAPPVELSRSDVTAIKALGYDVAPWSWLNEALDDGSESTRSRYRINAAGETMKHWAIDAQQWYHVCYTTLPAHQARALDKALSDITWDHFDVLACVPPLECYASTHPGHAGRPLARSEERDWIRRTFQIDRDRGLAVSSEGFNDAYAMDYDLGSVKAWPQYGHWPFWPVPLTSLVYHDSLIHSWWEVHNYNNPWHGRTRGPDQFEYGGGRPKLMAALDALMGCPPDVFPFGAQYAYTGRGKETFLYRFRFDDPEVQLALREALPVARLHRRVGKLEMTHFEILSEDGYVQESAFADGTHVVANFSRDTLGGIAGVDALLPESWQVVE